MAEEAQDRYTTLNGMRFHYREWGNADNPPLLLLHGVTGHARQWDRFAREMLDRFHIYALDQRGHGETDWGKSYRPQDFGEDIRAFVTELGLGPVAIVGQSLGQDRHRLRSQPSGADNQTRHRGHWTGCGFGARWRADGGSDRSGAECGL